LINASTWFGTETTVPSPMIPRNLALIGFKLRSAELRMSLSVLLRLYVGDGCEDHLGQEQETTYRFCPFHQWVVREGFEHAHQ
jgi:hypothetical protein